MNREILKSTIKALAAEGRELGRQIRRTSGLDRHALWDQKRQLGRRSRAALLAYGISRGVPYGRIEPRCRDGNRPQAASLAAMLRLLWPVPLTPQGEAGCDPWSEPQLRAWLENPDGAAASHPKGIATMR